MKGFKGMKLLTKLMSALLIIGFGASIAIADVPMTVSYQAELANVGNDPITMTFCLIAENEDPVTKWSETIQNIDVVNGVVSTVLGKINTISEEVLETANQLAIKINDGPFMQPYSELTSSIFAMRAAVADKLADGGLLYTSANLIDNVITGTHIQDETIEASDIKDGSITSEKIVVSVPTPKAPAQEGESASFTLDEDDQGLVLVSGDTTITLPMPSPANKGQKFTIKKTDAGLQRKGGKSEGSKPCDPRSNIVTIQVDGTNGSIDWFNQDGTFKTNNKFIEDRTNKITLEYKNAYATFISDGNLWYITDSNPTIDIFNPVPGDLGEIESPDNLTTGLIPLTLIPAKDCDECACDTCDDTLSYLPIFSKNNDHKLITLDDAIDQGFKCASGWIDITETENAVQFSCDPRVYGYTPGEVKMNVVVKDEANNLALYNPPGDIDPPYVSDLIEEPFLNNQDVDGNRGYIYLQWDAASDAVSLSDTLQYKTYLTDSNGNNEQIIFDYQTINDPYSAATPETVGYLGENKTKFAVRVYFDTQGLTLANYYKVFLVVKDEAGNEYQYNSLRFYAPPQAK